MRLDGIQHVALDVDDLDAAIAFYTGPLGCTVADRPDFGFPGAWLWAGAQMVHLVEKRNERPREGIGHHFAIQVDDLDAWVAHLQDVPIEVFAVPHTPGAGHQAFLRDPAGNLIELNQPE